MLDGVPISKKKNNSNIPSWARRTAALKKKNQLRYSEKYFVEYSQISVNCDSVQKDVSSDIFEFAINIHGLFIFISFYYIYYDFTKNRNVINIISFIFYLFTIFLRSVYFFSICNLFVLPYIKRKILKKRYRSSYSYLQFTYLITSLYSFGCFASGIQDLANIASRA